MASKFEENAMRLKKRFGDNYFRELGRKGGKKSWRNKGFACELIGPDGLDGRQRASVLGRKGGKKSKRGPKKSYWR